MDLTKGKGKTKELLNKPIGAFKALVAGLGNLGARLASVFRPGQRRETERTRVRDASRQRTASHSQMASKGAGLLKSGRGKFDAFADRLFGHFPAEKRRTMLLALGGLTALFLILIISILAATFSGPKKDVPAAMSAGPNIPSEDLFIPGEPDFLPDFILEREPRRSWSLEDVRPYWKNPANPELWRGEVKSAVDKLMESVP